MLCINMQKIPIKMSIINFHLNFQKYTLYMHLYKCIFNVHKKCEFYNALYLDIIRLGFYIFMWLFYAYLYIFLKKICIFPVHIFLLVCLKRDYRLHQNGQPPVIIYFKTFYQ